MLLLRLWGEVGSTAEICVLSLRCSLLAFSSGSPTATSAPKVALDVIPRSKEEFLPKEQWADWALSLSSANSEE